jgi:trimethylamine:corrinoid methyltransferase-like protein
LKKYEVELTKYPQKFTVMAKNKEEALDKAKNKVNWSVWESNVEEVD